MIGLNSVSRSIRPVGPARRVVKMKKEKNSEAGEVMVEYLMILLLVVLVVSGFEFSFKEILAPAFKRITAIIRWPIP